MDTSKGTIEVNLARAELAAAGGAGKDTRHLLTATLIYPRPGVAARSRVVALALENGRADWSARAWSDRIVFKENVEGPFALRVEISYALEADTLKRILEAVTSAALNAAGSGIEDAVSKGWGSDLAGPPIDLIEKAGSLSGGDSRGYLAAGVVDLALDDTWKGGDLRCLRIPVRTREDVQIMERRMVGGRMVSEPRTVVKANESLGFLELDIKRY